MIHRNSVRTARYDGNTAMMHKSLHEGRLDAVPYSRSFMIAIGIGARRRMRMRKESYPRRVPSSQHHQIKQYCCLQVSQLAASRPSRWHAPCCYWPCCCCRCRRNSGSRCSPAGCSVDRSLDDCCCVSAWKLRRQVPTRPAVSRTALVRPRSCLSPGRARFRHRQPARTVRCSVVGGVLPSSPRLSPWNQP